MDPALPPRPNDGSLSVSLPVPPIETVDRTRTRTPNRKGGDIRYFAAKMKAEKTLECLAEGMGVADSYTKAGWSQTSYKQYRLLHPEFRHRVDAIRGVSATVQEFDGSHASFARIYFGMNYAWFHLAYLAELERTPPGNILMALFPPDHGKTTMYENYANEKLATNPFWRGCIASENITIAKRILGRIRDRMEITGPTPSYVKRFGPFAPIMGIGRQVAQPWSSDHFNVFKKGLSDERDYSLLALGYGSSFVSTRTDHMHVDDVQSLKTLGETKKITPWFRQDCLSRAGEMGITTIAGTRVGEDDFYAELLEDTELEGIMKVVAFPALLTDAATQTVRPLWEERYTLEQMDRQRRKVGSVAWDRNYMQNPGASSKLNKTFLPEFVEPCLNPMISLRHEVTKNAIVYVTLDPALGSKNCVIALEVTPGKQLIVRRIREDIGFQRNEQIMAALETVIRSCNFTGRTTDVIVESKNFQAGLARDERLIAMRDRYGFTLREHLTGINKYDENIGLASMAEAFTRKEIVLPWADDEYTRFEIGELVRQLYAWKPGARGNKLRQDRVMALWFGWILWQSRWKTITDGESETAGWRREGLASGSVTPSSLVLPLGARP